MSDEAENEARKRISSALREGARSLSLLGLRLTALPAEIAQLTALQRLNLGGNQLTALPAEIAQLTALQRLDLGGNQLTALPAEIAQLTALQSLYLNGNQLTALPAEIAQLTALQSLFLRGNQLTALPAEIGQLIALQRLDLSDNQLTALPAEVGQLTALQRLYLRGNQLTALPAEIGDLVGLARAAEADSRRVTEGLHLDDNPLPAPYPQLIAAGQLEATRRVLAWLRGELEPEPLADPPPASDVPPPLPEQGAGPHVILDEEGRLAPAPPEDLDRDGNNLRLLRQLHPLLRDLARDLVAHLSASDYPRPHLRECAAAYLAQLDRDLSAIGFATLYFYGVRLTNAADAAEREITGNQPPISEAIREELASLLQTHGPFVLATVEGAEALELDARNRRDREEEARFRAAAQQLAAGLQASPGVARPVIADLAAQAAEEIGRGPNPVRSAAVGTATIGNVTIVLAAAATIAAMSSLSGFALAAGAFMAGGAGTTFVRKSLEKSRSFGRLTDRTAATIDAAMEADFTALKRKLAPHLRFILAHEQALRDLGYPWLTARLDWLKRNADSNDG